MSLAHRLRFWALLHVARSETSMMNARAATFDEQLGLYLDCARNLRDSLSAQGLQLTVLTNDIAELQRVRPNAGLELLEIPFFTRIPKSTPFFSAHYKLDAFDFLAAQPDDSYNVLCDLDIICINPLPVAFWRAISLGVPLTYEITDQMRPALGSERMQRDLDVVAGREVEGRWFGGEFVAGPSNFFCTLSGHVKDVMPRYLRHLHHLGHKSDETPLSAAIGLMRLEGVPVGDAGHSGVVHRHWGVSTRHSQRDTAYWQDTFLLHLPSDKTFLAGSHEWEYSSFVQRYSKHTRARRGPVGRLRRKIKRFIGSLREAFLLVGERVVGGRTTGCRARRRQNF